MEVLVTGGGGFVGGAIVDQLLDRGWSVRSVARRPYPALTAKGVATFEGDLAEPGVAEEAMAGCDGVFHVAAKAGVSGTAADFERSNVVATERVIEACRATKTHRLVYTSTPSVVHGGGDVEGVDESVAYPTTFAAPYPETKARAEQQVLASADEGLATVAIRPHLVWGPGDTQLVPRIIERARSGRARFVGDGSTIVDTTFIDNAAAAHLAAYDRLEVGSPISGKAYFVAQDEPRPIREIINDILTAVGVEPITKTIPFRAAWVAGLVAETVYRVVRPNEEPPMTRFLAEQLATAHWYDLTAARRDLDYAPGVTFAEGLDRLAASYGGAATA